MTTNVDDFLEHHGVKGQKWGRRKDRSNHGLNERARKLQAVADRRPTRGNVRTAQRAQRAAGSKYFAPTTKEERKAIRRSASGRAGQRWLGKAAFSIGVGIGSGVVVQKLVRKHADVHTARLAGNLTSFTGSMVAAHILDLNGTRKARSLNAQRRK